MFSHGRNVVKVAGPALSCGLAFAVVISTLLVGGSAQARTGTTTTIQAEQIALPAGSSIVNDATASGGKAVRLTQTKTSLSGTVSLSGPVTFVSVMAKGTRYKGRWPRMSMKIDGTKVIPLTTVAYSGWHKYSATVALTSGVHTLSITDAKSLKRGRYLRVDVVTLNGTAAPEPAWRSARGRGSPVPTTTTPPVSATAISPSYFGDHILGPLETNINGSGVTTLWPSWSPTTIRLWNTYGYYSSKGTYGGLAWSTINTANGVYDWSLFDAVLAKLKAKGVTDLIYTFGYTPRWAGGGTNGDQAPSSNQYLSTFATAVARRAIADGLPIRNWEVWNEPNNGVGTWTGTNAQMVAMAQAIHGAVKAVDPTYKVLTPSPQGNATTWMSGYLAAGGGAYADVMAFHGYTFSAPETIATLIDSYKSVYANYGQSAKPIWDTEAMDLRTSDATLQARFLAVYYLLHQAKGVERLYWYAYDGDQGQEWFSTTGSSAAANADSQIHSWMLGATPGSLLRNGTIYSLPLTKGGVPTLSVWNSAGASAYATGSYTSYTDLQGAVHPISGGTVTIGQTPILLR